MVAVAVELGQPDQAETPGKIHRHYEPLFKKSVSACVLVKRFLALVQGHDWNLNPFMKALRLMEEKRCAIRSEARQTLTEVMKALYYHMDFSTDSEYALECRVSVETIAKEIGQHHIYPNGRVAYDPVLNALKMLENAGLIIIAREFDHTTRRHKAMRVFGTIKLCDSFGISLNELRAGISKMNQHREKLGLLPTDQEKLVQHYVREISARNIAEIKSNITKQKLKWIKKQLVEDKVAVNEEQKSAVIAKIDAANEVIKQSQQQQEPISTEYGLLRRKVMQKYSIQKIAQVENQVLQDHPGIERGSDAHTERIKQALKALLDDD